MKYSPDEVTFQFGDIKVKGGTWAPDLVELPKDAPSVPAHSRTGTAKAGPQGSAMKQCAKSEWHGFHPSAEACPYCGPVVDANGYVNVSIPQPERAASWWANVHTGVVYDLNTPGWTHYKANPDFFPLISIKAHTFEAKRVCGCSTGGKCQVFKNKKSGNECAVHFAPRILKDDEWSKV